jgi:hypothetical protein
MRVHFVERDDIYLHRPSGMCFDLSLNCVYNVPGGFDSDSTFLSQGEGWWHDLLRSRAQ